ncbi:MAG: hypothetical protein WC450_06415 [Candidatus Omnitrophota bacterium]
MTTVLLIIVASVSIYGITVFIVERLAASPTRAAHLETVYLAQAGIHQALYDFRSHDLAGGGYFSLGQTDVDSSRFFVIGGNQSDLLLVDTSQVFLGGEYTPDECRAIGRVCRDGCLAARTACYAACDVARTECRADAYAVYQACVAQCPGGSQGWWCRYQCQLALTAAYTACDQARTNCRAQCYDDYLECRSDCTEEQQDCIDGHKLTGITIQNVTDSQTIIIDRMRVSWDNSYQLEQIVIDGQLVWNGSVSSTADANLNPDFTLNASQTVYDIDYLQFSGSMADATTVSIEFVMADGSAKTITVYPESDISTITVRATGKTSGSEVYRTIAATYDVGTGTVNTLEETNEEITP